MRRMLTACVLTAAAALAGLASGADESGLKKSVVKIFVVAQPADYNQPWSMRWQNSVNGSGFILDGGRVMTNAHVVSDRIFVQVLKAGDTRKYTAEVEHVAHDCEIAILRVEDASFFEGTVPVRFGGLPDQRDKVAAYGFPTGGNELSITEGIVSRIEVHGYSHSKQNLLAIQTDAAINPGNSGGPVFKEGRLIGISFQTYRDSETENIGYIVPVPIIQRFLDDIGDGRYDGVPGLGVFWQKMENASLRARYGMRDGQSGVLVTKVMHGSSSWDVLREGDVITEIDGTPIANNGTIRFRKEERVGFGYALNLRQVGEKLPLKILRDAKLQDLTLPLAASDQIVPQPRYDVRPTYFIFGGLVFTVLTYNYMDLWSKWTNVPYRFRYHYSDGLASEDRREVVIINQVLPHDVNVGYHDLRDLEVRTVNGRPVAGIRDVVAAFGEPAGDYDVVEVENYSSGWAKLVFDAKRVRAVNGEILERFRIPSDRSEDLR